MTLARCLAAVAMLAPARAQVAGTVLDAESGEPLVGAVVSRQATAVQTETDADGAFRLDLGDGPLVLAAATPGYFVATLALEAPADGVAIELERVPDEDDADYPFFLPEECGACHPFQHDGWDDSAMGHSGANRWVYDLYDGSGTPGGAGGFVYARDSAHAAANPASECAACHQPARWLREPFSPLLPREGRSEGELGGVVCDVCHKIAQVDPTRADFPGLYPGVVRMTRPAGGAWPVVYGVLGDVSFVQDPIMRAAYQPQLPANICAACHQHRNDPDDDGEFAEDGGVVADGTWDEWRASPYGDPGDERHATCADCHMAAAAEPDACIVNVPSLGRPLGDVRAHGFPGTTSEMLAGAVSLTLAASLDGGRVEAEVTLTNAGAGHFVPTGEPMRNVLLRVEAWREDDGLLLAPLGDQALPDLAGVGDPADGYWAGLPGKLYARVLADAAGAAPAFPTEAASVAEDTRLAPLASDTTRYAFRAPADGGELRVLARLVYRRAWRELVDAKGWTEDGRDRPLADLAPPDFGVLMAQASQTLGTPPPGGDGAGADGGCGCALGRRP